MKIVSIAVILIWIAVTIIYYGVPLFIGNTAADKGLRLQQLEIIAGQIKLDNQLLENEVARQSSLEVIREKALQMGFTDSKKLEYIE